MNGSAPLAKAYPNELTGYRFYSTAKWNVIKPLVSTMGDVRRILGEPTEAHDVAAFTKPYPGDSVAKQPVFSYYLNSDWQLLVYFVKYCFQGYVPLPASLDDKVCSIDLLPRKPRHFQQIKFPSVFISKPVKAYHGAWIEYSDRKGLVYNITTQPGSYDKESKLGDLDRIVYTASDALFKEYSERR
jgi:hypothetical protein